MAARTRAARNAGIAVGVWVGGGVTMAGHEQVGGQCRRRSADDGTLSAGRARRPARRGSPGGAAAHATGMAVRRDFDERQAQRRGA